MVKLLENTFRAVNIGLVNELALMCHKMDIDVWEVIDAAGTSRSASWRSTRGPASAALHPDRSVLPVVEGQAAGGFEARFIELAGQVNGDANTWCSGSATP